MASFEVPSDHQHRVLLFGIVIALVLRGVFIAVGAAVIDAFVWVFYLFGAFLIFTAVKLARRAPSTRSRGQRERARSRCMEQVLPDHRTSTTARAPSPASTASGW